MTRRKLMNWRDLPPEQITPQMHRLAAAYHEAGHAAVAYWYGWAVTKVELGDIPRTEIKYITYQRTTEQACIFGHAGWIAEYRFHNRGPVTYEREAVKVLNLIRSNVDLRSTEYADERGECDFIDTARLALEERPDITEGEFRSLYRQYDAKALQIISTPLVWRSLEKIAEKLSQEGQLSDPEIVAAVGQEDFSELFGRANSEWWRGDAIWIDPNPPKLSLWQKLVAQLRSPHQRGQAPRRDDAARR